VAWKKRMAETLDRILRAAAFRNEEIAELGGATIHSLRNWRYGKSRPSAVALEALAKGLVEKAAQLYRLAGDLEDLAADLRPYDPDAARAAAEAELAAFGQERISDEEVEEFLKAHEAFRNVFEPRLRELQTRSSDVLRKLVTNMTRDYRQLQKGLREVERERKRLAARKAANAKTQKTTKRTARTPRKK
jgi:hypothetical protein